jgi:hypothetical protein
MAGSAILAIKIIADATDAVGGLAKTGEGIDGLDGKSKGLMGSLGGVTSMLGPAALAGAAVGAAVVIADLTKAAAEDRAEQEKLITTYGNVGIGVDEATAATQRAIDAGADKAFSDSEVREGLDGLIRATGDADEANDLLAAAMDIARQAGVPLAQAADAVAKAHGPDGVDGALRKLLPGMGKQATAADTITEATRLSQGAADDYAKSAEGMSKKGQDAFGELGEEIGGAFLPIMDELLPLIGPIVELLGELIKAVLPLIKPAVKIAVEGVKLLIDALKLVMEWVGKVIDGVKKVIDWVGQMIDIAVNAKNQVEGALDQITPWSVVPPVPPAPVVAGFAGRGARAIGPPPGGVTNVNVNVTSADPGEVMRAVRRWARSNGGSGPFTRGLDRSTA